MNINLIESLAMLTVIVCAMAFLIHKIREASDE